MYRPNIDLLLTRSSAETAVTVLKYQFLVTVSMMCHCILERKRCPLITSDRRLAKWCFVAGIGQLFSVKNEKSVARGKSGAL